MLHVKIITSFAFTCLLPEKERLHSGKYLSDNPRSGVELKWEKVLKQLRYRQNARIVKGTKDSLLRN
jgi:hypothetical protein